MAREPLEPKGPNGQLTISQALSLKAWFNAKFFVNGLKSTDKIKSQLRNKKLHATIQILSSIFTSTINFYTLVFLTSLTLSFSAS